MERKKNDDGNAGPPDAGRLVLITGKSGADPAEQ
jgi:hypothetical protein